MAGDPGSTSSALRPLPIPPTPFIGREAEVAHIVEQLSNPDVRLLVLTGPGGTGKSRLGLQVASTITEAFKDGVVWVPLESITEANLVVETIARGFGIQAKGSIPAADLLMAYFRRRQVLLVLDSFERVMAASSSVAELLAGCAGLTILVTSREILHLQGEYDFPVPPLSLPDREAPVDTDADFLVTRYEAIHLFADRAAAARPGFRVTSENASIVANICRRLDGLPLALELAAARIRLFPPAKMLERLDNSLSLLTRGATDRPSRQQTLRGTIDWSYDLLDDAERKVFGRLSVFAGGLTLEAAEQVCGPAGHEDYDVLDSIASIEEKSLIEREDSGGEQRFVMLETVREYAAEVLNATGSLNETRKKHAEYYSAFAEETERESVGVNHLSWAKKLERERFNLRAALVWCFGGGDVELGLELVDRRGVAVATEYFTEIRDWVEMGIAEGRTPTASLANVICLSGVQTCSQGALSRGMSLLEYSLAMSRELKDSEAIINSLGWMGAQVFWNGHFEKAAVYVEEWLALSRETGNDQETGGALGLLGRIAAGRGDLGLAQSLSEEGLIYLEGTPNIQSSAVLRMHLAGIHMMKGDNTRAAALAEESLISLRQAPLGYVLGMVLHLLATIGLRRRDLGGSKAMFLEALPIFLELLDRRGIVDGHGWVSRCLTQLADIAVLEGRVEHAVGLLGAAGILDEQAIPWVEPSIDRFDELCKSAREQLGDKRYDELWQEGQAMSLEEAIKYASEEGGSTDAAAAAASFPDGLSRREVDVAALLVEGLTNREIGDRLFIAERTVANHVQSVLNKTGSGNRAEAAAYAIRHGLTD